MGMRPSTARFHDLGVPTCHFAHLLNAEYHWLVAKAAFVFGVWDNRLGQKGIIFKIGCPISQSGGKGQLGVNVRLKSNKQLDPFCLLLF